MSSLTPTQVNELLQGAGTDAAVYLIGAGGCGMSGLGHLLLDLGHRVAGTDLALNEEVRQLRARGAQIHVGHHADQIIAARPALVVYSSAIRRDNSELKAAQQLRIPVVRRAVLLAALLQRQCGICVAGMHGKTTTTALLAFALERLGARPSYAVGALVPQFDRHARFSQPSTPSPAAGVINPQPFFVVEADESDGTLREFQPEHAIVLNVDEEHLDYFANLEAICREFECFAAQTRDRLVFCADDARLAGMFPRRPHAVSYGFHPLATYRIETKALSATPQGIPPMSSTPGPQLSTAFEVWHEGQKLVEIATRLLGEQNVSNAAAVVALLHQLGFTPDNIARALASFTGAARRQQELFGDTDFRVFDDYGHHPSEIRATLRAMKALSPRRLLVAFQPHRYTRTRLLLQQFAAAFAAADRLWLTEVYAAGEAEIPGVNSAVLAEAIRLQGQAVELVASLDQLPVIVRNAMQPGDLVLFLGAGDITKAAHQLVADLRTATPALKEKWFAELVAKLSPGTVLRRDEPLAKRTTLRVGGPADYYVEPQSEAELAEVLRFCAARHLPFVLLGRGSNLLVRDGGVRGVVICLAHPNFSRVEMMGERIFCGAGAKLKAVANEARRHGLTGLEFLEGVPGSVGGALRMNAGAMGSWMFDVVESIRFMDYRGQAHERNAAEVNVEYRGCPLFKNHIALGAVLKGQPARKEAIAELMNAFSKKRWETQPPQSSAGCIFKNPKTIPAGKLIDELALKGARVGGAVVSDVHGNFIVNEGSATARDVLSLIEIIQQRARAARGIELETEVEIIGE